MTMGRRVAMTERRPLKLFAVWFGFVVGTILWFLIGVSGVPLSVSRAVVMFGATVFNFGAVARALRIGAT
jgi:hypothetical protein